MERVCGRLTGRLLAIAAATMLCGCYPERPEGWAEDSHGRDAEPAYDYLFDDSAVHRIDITIASEDHRVMLDEIEERYGNRGGLPPPDGQDAPAGEPPPGGTPPQGGPPAEPGDPVWMPVTVELDGVGWWHVGMRFKGNSSLMSAVREGVAKIAFRLDFDKFEDDYPSIHNQRFYGFGKMTFSNGFKDASLIRDKLAADIFRRGGVPAARGAFARVYVDSGAGPVYHGLYTMIEDPADLVLGPQFTDNSGNLYKPEGESANWSRFEEACFEKKTNEDEGHDDVIAAIAALQASRDDAAVWREGLEAVFDVPGFLRWLAVNQAMENWDSYLCIPHNYYLYGNPADQGRLTWIPWDLNEALLEGGRCPSDSVLLDEADASRPLIRFLLDDPAYRQVYEDELHSALAGAFDTDWVISRMEAYHQLVAPWVVGPDGESAPYTFLKEPGAFEASLDGHTPTALRRHVIERRDVVERALRASSADEEDPR